jgi:O-antigen biosynthesis protein
MQHESRGSSGSPGDSGLDLQALLAECAGPGRLLDASPRQQKLRLGKRLERVLRKVRRELARFCKRRVLWWLPGRRPPNSLFDSTPRSPDDIHLRAHDEPVVSIIIPIHNHFPLTLSCLYSIATARCETPFEVILVDDASTEGDAPWARIANLRVLRNSVNEGFVGSCNRGAREAQGEYLHFLNNDTLVRDGWLDHLVGTCREAEDFGMVGSKLLSADGSLQEAGGIVWNDGSAWNFGRGKDPDSPEFSYARDVDYCSGASILVPRRLFLDLGLFDEVYRPGYYEDVDLAFRVRAAGRRVVYQPASQVVHWEGATAGRDLKSGMKQHQVRNQQTFRERWREPLARHRPHGVLPELEKERQVVGRVLIIDHRIPEPDKDAGSVRMWHLIRILQRLGNKVTFIPDDLSPIQPHMARLQAAGVEVLHVPYVKSVSQYLGSRGGLFEHVILSRVSVAEKHIDDVRRHCPQARVLFDTVDLHFLREKRQASLNPTAPSSWRKTMSRELNVAGKSDITLVVSSVERQLLSTICPHLQVEVVSTIYDSLEAAAPFEERRGLLFIGGFEHPPNVDACRWLIQEIMPRLWARHPEMRLQVIGSKVTPEILALASERVEILGYVPDVAPRFATARISVAPLRFGAGVKGKINQSLALGVPCVATAMAAEGMGLANGHDIVIADDSQAFADAIGALHSDEGLWRRISTNGLSAARSRFSAAAAQEALARCLEPGKPALPRRSAA